MNRLSKVLVALVALCACTPAGEQPASPDAWVGTITSEGNVTTVVNESGSAWGGTATLVEEASIGVESGAEEYMFGMIGSLYATDERIYLVDRQVPAVRVYDSDGLYLHTLGGQGQGPGEYTRPALVAADDSGRAFVLDSGTQRVNVYDAAGTSIDTWEGSSRGCCAWPMFPLANGYLWLPVGDLAPDGSRMLRGMQVVNAAGLQGDITWPPDIEFEQATYDVEGFDHVAPFGAWLVWSGTADGGMLAGASDRYRYEVHRPDGSLLVVERRWEPVPVPAEHREWERRYQIAFQRRGNDPDFTWDGAEIPDHKAAYRGLLPTQSGEVWVQRSGESKRLSDCVEDPIEAGHQAAWEKRCWEEQSATDVFGADGRYLGEVDTPPGLSVDSLRASIRGRRVVSVFQDPAGTYMVKRYRLVPPGES